MLEENKFLRNMIEYQRNGSIFLKTTKLIKFLHIKAGSSLFLVGNLYLAPNVEVTYTRYKSSCY